MKPVDVTSLTQVDFGTENNDKEFKFEVCDQIRKSKYKNIFAKGHAANCSENAFVIKKVKNTVLWTYVIKDLSSKEILIEKDKSNRLQN